MHVNIVSSDGIYLTILFAEKTKYLSQYLKCDELSSLKYNSVTHQITGRKIMIKKQRY